MRRAPGEGQGEGVEVNRRSLFRAALSGAVLGLARHLPMPSMTPQAQREPAANEHTLRWLAELFENADVRDAILVTREAAALIEGVQ